MIFLRSQANLKLAPVFAHLNYSPCYTYIRTGWLNLVATKLVYAIHLNFQNIQVRYQVCSNCILTLKSSKITLKVCNKLLRDYHLCSLINFRDFEVLLHYY